MRKPWNIPNLPVYSLATYQNNRLNMNICTYVSAISMNPKLYAVAVYENTQTLENIEKSEYAVLQLLHESHFQLVKKLGQTSGKKYNKEQYLKKKELLDQWNNYTILKDLSAVVLLKKISKQLTGDHYLYIFEAIKHKSFNTNYLMINELRNRKIIRG